MRGFCLQQAPAISITNYVQYHHRCFRTLAECESCSISTHLLLWCTALPLLVLQQGMHHHNLNTHRNLRKLARSVASMSPKVTHSVSIGTTHASYASRRRHRCCCCSLAILIRFTPCAIIRRQQQQLSPNGRIFTFLLVFHCSPTSCQPYEAKHESGWRRKYFHFHYTTENSAHHPLGAPSATSE